MHKIFPKIKIVSPISNLLVGLIYAMVYDYIYKNYIAVAWGYTAFREYIPMSLSDYFTYLFLASFPFVFYKGIKYIASTFSLFVYIFVYIPFMNALLVYGFPESMKVSYCLVFFVFMVLYFKTDHLTILKKWIVEYKRRIPFSVIPSITVFLFVVLIALNVSQLHFVNFFTDAAVMYEYRESANIQLILVLCWLRAVFLPLLMLYYLSKGKYMHYAYTFVGFVLIFMLDQQKMTIVFPFAITAIFYAIKKYGTNFSSMFHLFVICIFIVIPLILIRDQENPIYMVLSLIIIVRIQCIAGKQLEKYMDFFEIRDNPFTYYTHIGVIKSITGLYPYQQSIGQVINDGESNSNATFFLMDGVAASGVWGCIIIGVIFLLVKSLLNSFSYVYSVPILTALFLFQLQSLMNVSLFTTLFTHGIILLFFILLFVDIKEFKKTKC